MTNTIYFGVWAPDEATFWQAWIAAGICTAPNEYATPYAGMVETTTTWPGIVTRADGSVVPGWHTNVKVVGALADQFTAGLPTEGDIWTRTRAAQVFSLTQQPADETTGFPAGYRSVEGVTYADPSAFNSPSNVWA